MSWAEAAVIRPRRRQLPDRTWEKSDVPIDCQFETHKPSERSGELFIYEDQDIRKALIHRLADYYK